MDAVAAFDCFFHFLQGYNKIHLFYCAALPVFTHPGVQDGGLFHLPPSRPSFFKPSRSPGPGELWLVPPCHLSNEAVMALRSGFYHWAERPEKSAPLPHRQVP